MGKFAINQDGVKMKSGYYWEIILHKFIVFLASRGIITFVPDSLFKDFFNAK